MSLFEGFALWVLLCVLATIGGKSFGRYVNRRLAARDIRRMRAERGAFSDPALRFPTREPVPAALRTPYVRAGLDTSRHGRAEANGARESAGDALGQRDDYGTGAVLIFPEARQ